MPAVTLLQHRLQVGQIEERERHAARRPGEREHGRHDVGGLGRTLLQASAGSARSTGGRRWRRTGPAPSLVGRPNRSRPARGRLVQIGAGRLRTGEAAADVRGCGAGSAGCGGGDLGSAGGSADGLAGSSDTLRTCWMAVSVSSVGSVSFFGLFAMSAVASLVTWVPRTGTSA